MPVDTSHDQDQKDVRPTPDKPCLTVRRGARVITLRGAGKVKDILLSLSEFADNLHQLTPPQVVVELDEPWDGEMFITTYLHKCRWPGKGDVFAKACKRLWPDQVQEDPAVSLRPTDTPTERGRPMKISERLKKATSERKARAKPVADIAKDLFATVQDSTKANARVDHVRGLLQDLYSDATGTVNRGWYQARDVKNALDSLEEAHHAMVRMLDNVEALAKRMKAVG